MVLDHLIELPATRADMEDAIARTTRWARRSRDAHSLDKQIQFGIVQGGLDPALRKSSAEQLVDLDFPGYAIGGLSVGEAPEDMYSTIAVTETVPTHGQAKIFDGSRKATGLDGGSSPGRRHVRLRDADSKWPQRDGFH